MADPAAIRSMLQTFDSTSIAPTRQAVAMLDKITEDIVSYPQKYQIDADPGE
jgi:hypothetical protein